MARADAARNREKILTAAREAFAAPGAEPSMAEVSRRAGVGMATLYRNFPGRRELLEALYEDEVDAMCAAAATVEGVTPGARFEAWLRRFLAFIASKHPIGDELLTHVGEDRSLFNTSRDRILAGGRPLFEAAQGSGELREDLTFEQVLDMLMAVNRIRGDASYTEPILEAALGALKR